jgi:hypothetical protein
MGQSRKLGKPNTPPRAPRDARALEPWYRRDALGQGISSLEYGGFDVPVHAPVAPAHWGAGHHGKGPKNYQRSDERIREEVCERLTFDPDIDASDICVYVKDREVRLTGYVRERALKDMVERLIEHVAGVEGVHNELRVRPRTRSLRGDQADVEERTRDGRTRWGTATPTTQDS